MYIVENINLGSLNRHKFDTWTQSGKIVLATKNFEDNAITRKKKSHIATTYPTRHIKKKSRGKKKEKDTIFKKSVLQAKQMRYLFS